VVIKVYGVFFLNYFGVNMSEPDFPYSKKPNKPKNIAFPPTNPSPDLPPGHPPNTPPLKTQPATENTNKKSLKTQDKGKT
jgi:hypothetical protein